MSGVGGAPLREMFWRIGGAGKELFRAWLTLQRASPDSPSCGPEGRRQQHKLIITIISPSPSKHSRFPATINGNQFCEERANAHFGSSFRVRLRYCQRTRFVCTFFILTLSCFFFPPFNISVSPLMHIIHLCSLRLRHVCSSVQSCLYLYLATRHAPILTRILTFCSLDHYHSYFSAVCDLQAQPRLESSGSE